MKSNLSNLPIFSPFKLTCYMAYQTDRMQLVERMSFPGKMWVWHIDVTSKLYSLIFIVSISDIRFKVTVPNLHTLLFS